MKLKILNKEIEWSNHSIERLEEMGVTKEVGEYLINVAKWHTMPLGRLQYKFKKNGHNQMGCFYLLCQKTKTNPKILFTLREYKNKVVVITCTEKT